MRLSQITLSILIILFLLMFSVRSVVFDQGFYYHEYERNNVYDHFNESTISEATDSLLHYLRGKGTLSDFYNDKEKQHMRDVKHLVDRVNFLFFFFLGLLIINFFFIYKYNKKTFTKDVADSFIFSLFLILPFMVLIYLFRNSFSSWFTAFHLVFFNNDLWLLNPETDKIILLFPEAFFYGAFFQIMLRLMLSLLFLAVLALLIKMLR